MDDPLESVRSNGKNMRLHLSAHRLAPSLYVFVPFAPLYLFLLLIIYLPLCQNASQNSYFFPPPRNLSFHKTRPLSLQSICTAGFNRRHLLRGQRGPAEHGRQLVEAFGPRGALDVLVPHRCHWRCCCCCYCRRHHCPSCSPSSCPAALGQQGALAQKLDQRLALLLVARIRRRCRRHSGGRRRRP